MNRFDLEEQIMQAWATKTDIDTLRANIINYPNEWCEARIDNALNGLSILHEVRCQKLFKIFEELIFKAFIE